jgi:hypothetical protein
MQNIQFHEEMLKTYPDSDGSIPFYCESILAYATGCRVLSAEGENMMLSHINETIAVLEKDKTNQQEILKGCLYFTICYNLSTLFLGYLDAVDFKQTIRNPLPLLELLGAQQQRVRIHAMRDVYAKVLKSWLNHLDMEFLMKYNSEKRRCWVNDVFKTEIMIDKEMQDAMEMENWQGV